MYKLCKEEGDSMRKRKIEDIRKRIAKRKAEQQRYTPFEQAEELFPELGEGEAEFGDEFGHVVFEEPKEEARSVFRKEVFLMQLLCSAALVLGIGIMFKSNNPSLEQARTTVQKVMQEEFQFAAVSNWYEGQFGKPLTLLPTPQTQSAQKEKNYAVPASGKVLQSFKANGQGVFVQTNINAPVDAMNEGVAVFVGKKEGLGNTIIIQHADGTESWYGNLSEATIALYDYVKQKQKIGVVANSEDGKSGTFYFALKKENQFIDPIQVISFE